MGKKLVLLVFSLTSISAHAQSSITLYGWVEEGILYTNNQKGASAWQTDTGQTNGSRWGLRGVEDLGGKTKAVFTLENGFDPSNGKLSQGGREFGRQAFVGLQTPFGTGTLGRQYDPAYDYIGRQSAAAMWSWFGTHPGDFDNLNATFRIDNAIKYTSPLIGGFGFEGLYAPGGQPGSTEHNRIYSVAAKYSLGSFLAAVSFLNVNNPSVVGYGSSVDPGATGYTSPEASPVYSGYASAQDLHVLGVAASYSIDPVTIGAVFTNTRFINVLPTTTTPFTGGSATFSAYEVNARYQITPAIDVGTSFDYTSAERAHYAQWHLGGNYFFSKRTNVNLVGVWQHASGVDSTGHAAVADISSISPSTTANQVAVKLILQHRF
jgi:predicted porin